jgi:hypothetical protein
MKRYLLLAAICSLSLIDPAKGWSQEASITIDSIVANDAITGHVSGLQSGQYARYKVLVYAHTDQWYIHPYAGQGEGKSWASIAANGTWHLSTVQREFRADRVAALLVTRDYPEPSKIENLEDISSDARLIKDLSAGTPDYGKL